MDAKKAGLFLILAGIIGLLLGIGALLVGIATYLQTHIYTGINMALVTTIQSLFIFLAGLYLRKGE